MRVLLWLYRAKENKHGEAPIYVRITVNGKREQFATGCYASPSTWDKEKQRIRGRGDKSKAINNQLSAIRRKLDKIYGEASLVNEQLSAEDIKNYYFQKEEDHSLCQVYLQHIQKIEPLVGKEFVKATFNRYVRERKYLKEFITSHYKRSDIRLKDLKPAFLEEYIQFLKLEKGHQVNHAYKVIQRLRKVVQIAINNGWLDKNPFSEVKIKRTKVELVYLTENELERLENKDIDIPRLSLVRDMFVFQCFTGLAFRELELLKHDNIRKGSDGELWIISTRQKTLKPFKVPLLPKAEQLMLKYKREGCDQVFPVISNIKYNAYLKEIADICGIRKRLTTHVGRKTFATTVTLLNGVPLASVASMLGHSSILTTQASYAEVLDEKLSRDMKRLRDKYK